MSARFQGPLLIHVGFVKNKASRLRQTEGTPHLRSALAREGLDTGNSGCLPGPPTPPGEHIPPRMVGWEWDPRRLRTFRLSGKWGQ